MNFQKLKLNKHFFFSLFTAVGIGLFVSAIFVSAADWTAPPASPPTCPDSNPACNTPLNVSASTQSKIGALGIGGVFEAFSDAFFDGKVGIGAGSPYLGSKLNVGGIGSSYSAIYGTHDTIGVYGRGTNVDGGGGLYSPPVYDINGTTGVGVYGKGGNTGVIGEGGYYGVYGFGSEADFVAGKSGYRFPDRTIQTTSMAHACTFCLSCGGSWPIESASLGTGEFWGYGDNCGGGKTRRTPKNNKVDLCCK